jgi:hypothetical protein
MIYQQRINKRSHANQNKISSILDTMDKLQEKFPALPDDIVRMQAEVTV